MIKPQTIQYFDSDTTAFCNQPGWLDTQQPCELLTSIVKATSAEDRWDVAEGRRLARLLGIFYYSLQACE